MTFKQLLSVFLISVCALSASAQESENIVLQPCRRGTFRYDRLHRRAGQEQDRGPGGDYFTGTKHQLVVLASFADNPFMGDEAATLAKWDTILNTVQLNQPPFVGSLRDYFYDQSYGQFDLVFDLQFVQVDSCSRYRSTMTDDENSQYLVQDIMDTLRLRTIEWDRYDWNGDSYVNQLLIIFAGQGSAYGHMGPSYNAIWPHQWWLSMHLKDRQQGVYCSPDTICYQGADFIVDAYCAVQELSSDSTYGTFGTICHEYTHCFGFPDFYGYSGKVIGEWDLMDSGNYNENGFRPTGFSAHERWIMGWLTPVELTESTTVTGMPALTDQPVAYLIRNDAYPNEFYMLENRQQEGWDAALPGSGLAVFHIDYDPEIWLTGEANTNNQKHYTLIPANNSTATYYNSGWAYPYVSGGIVNNALTNTSEPAATLWHANTDGTKLMSKPVTDISVTDGLVSFSFMAAPEPITNITFPPVDEELSPAGAQARKVFRNGNLYILLGDKTYTLQGQVVR